MAFDLEILFENDDVCVVNKPVGVMVHEDGTSEGETVVDWLLRRAPKVRGVGEPGYSPTGKELERSGVVHRLDRDTSGVLLLVKTEAAFLNIKQQFHDRLVKKEYEAIVYGKMKERYGTITKPIGRSPADFRKRSAQPGAKGQLRDAVTEWECVKTGEYQGEQFSYLILKPKTGRTHQLRVHLRAIDRPIVGDQLYSTHLLSPSSNLGLERMALHARALSCTLPEGEAMTFTTTAPFASLQDQLN